MTALAPVTALPVPAGAPTPIMGVRAGPDSIDPHRSTTIHAERARSVA